MNVYQLRGEHELWENSGNKIIWTASYTRGKQSTPDLRLFINTKIKHKQYINYRNKFLGPLNSKNLNFSDICLSKLI